MKPIRLAACIAFSLAPFASAQEGVREKIRELETKAAAAQAEGRSEETEKLRKAIGELSERAKADAEKRDGERRERPQREELRTKLDQSRQELAEAEKNGQERAAAEIRQRITRLEGTVRSEGGRREGEGKQHEMGDAKRRLQHLNEAIEHLRAAGMREPAESLSEQARVLKAQLTQQSGRRDNPGHNVEGQLNEIREGMKNLQRQMQEMQKRLEDLSRERK
jgi:chromosome segregation ATPase